MKAALFYGSGKPLQIEEVEVRKPGRGEVLVRVVACGVCHTDLHYTDHGVPTFKEPPVILGHEVSGIVEEVGEGVNDIKSGMKVLVPPVFTCGKCYRCRTGRENICDSMVMVGNNVDGGYAEFMIAPARDVIPLPEEIPLEEGAVIADAISTPYHAIVNRAKVMPGESVAVFGCGGLGLNAIQIASAMGAFVIGIDIKEKKLELARSFGAHLTLKYSEDVAKQIRRVSGGGVDVAIEAIGNPQVMEMAFSCVRTGGRLVIMGYSPHNVSLNAGRIMYREMEIIGTLGCPPYAYMGVIELVRRGRIKVKEVVTHKFTLDEINDAFALLRNGDENLIRAVVLPGK